MIFLNKVFTTYIINKILKSFLIIGGGITFLIFPQDIFAEYVPIGKYIWFNLTPASNSTLGGMLSSVCPANEFVMGVFENGTLNCAVP